MGFAVIYLKSSLIRMSSRTHRTLSEDGMALKWAKGPIRRAAGPRICR